MEKRMDKVVFCILAWLVGSLGVDRFMRGQTGLGVLKLLTCGGAGVWALADLVIALTKLSKYDKEFVFINGNWADDVAPPQ